MPSTGVAGAGGMLDLVAIPAALVGVTDGRLIVETANTRFVALGIDPTCGNDGIGAHVATFLRDDTAQAIFAWRTGAFSQERHFQVTLARLRHRLEPVCLVSFVEETGEVRTRQSLRREMTIDSLTGLPNRTGLGDRLEELVAESGRSFAVMMIDLERFSRIDACFGSLAGDELLITVARRLRGALRAHDTLARTGGDQFGVLITIDRDVAEAETAAARIRAALGAPFRLGEFEIRVTAAIGMACGDDAADAEEVIRNAQFALKRAKASGRLETHRPEALDAARDRFAMETALRRAIEGDRLSLAFQPVCDLATGRIVSFEALARWTDDNGRDVSPNEFIPVAEESGLILPLGRWAIDAALTTLAEWDVRSGGNCGVAVAVNLSAIQLQRDTIVSIVAQALERHGVSGRRLKLEITESALIADPDRIAETLHALKALGTAIAMDDFGTGYSNLAYLQSLPIDVLKVDRSFVTDMLADPDKAAITRAVLSLAQALGMETVAEGVETERVAATLGSFGCTYGQGYIFSRPVPADEAYALLRERNS